MISSTELDEFIDREARGSTYKALMPGDMIIFEYLKTDGQRMPDLRLVIEVIRKNNARNPLMDQIYVVAISTENGLINWRAFPEQVITVLRCC